ncbi:UbiX family flavin prenyltransferase [Lacisediminimonas sp.]|uniref:UbiX family flavin prenyltransferase n=1 Tax=Lacisediminimonas sp. TaxID=3060582 RepID=UPI00271B853C|nr:UbiX family flavin prenyltransferase [Lacisediminimonas sp.]MDO8301535.1 UbiX family flavin prenyltransferase [Lacisediminimonas sp.]
MNSTSTRPRIVVAITGASGSVYGIRLLQQLRESGACETHLVMSSSGALTAAQEMSMKKSEIEALADVVHSVKDIGATIASGSFHSVGMVIAPCSMKTLASVAHGFSDNLVTRAADVMLKERRKLVLMVRETPFNLAHLRNMTAVTEMGGIVFPPLPAFYSLPETLDDVIQHTVGRVLDLFAIPHTGLVKRWEGMKPAK